MQCEYCKKVLKTQSSLKFHQKTAKYCLDKQNIVPQQEHQCSCCGTIFTLKSSLNSHLTICKVKKDLEASIIKEESIKAEYEKQKTLELSLLREENLRIAFEKQKEIICELKKDLESSKNYSEKLIADKDRIIEEQKIIIKEFQDDQRKQNKDLTDRIHSMAEKAIAKPSTLNQNIINNMMPITDAHLQEHVQNLNPVHVQNGASGYAKYALEYPLKDMIVCTDFQRRNCKYKDENGNVVSDPEMTKITKRLFSAIKERNEELINEYSAELQAKWKSMNVSSNPDMDQEESEHFASKTNEALEIAMDILSQKRQTSEMANGMRPDLFYGFVRELAAGCYRSEKC
jgi:hypothetical protein